MSASNEHTNINLNEKIELKKTEEIKIHVKPAKRFKFSLYPKRIKNILSPENPPLLKRILKPSFVLGILLGFSIGFYYTSIEVFTFLNRKERLMKEEIKSLKKEIKELKRI